MSLYIPRDVLDEILNRVDLVQTIGEHVPLKKSGKDFKGLCPFHQEKTPSFFVNPTKGIFYCFGCSVGGNLYSFLMKVENLSFVEACEKLAQRAGVDLKPYQKKRAPGGQALGQASGQDLRESFYKINRYVAWFFENHLNQVPGKKAKTYLEKRGISPESIQAFKLGYAPLSWNGLTTFLQDKKVPLEYAEKLGLIKKRKDGSYYDFFRDRVMFPIIDDQDRIIGFSGRRLNDADKESAKYINSAESPIYHKGDSIFGRSQAKKAIRKEDGIVLVEGQLDVITLWQGGVQNSVAPLGTALTLSQVGLLKRYTNNFYLMFDGDSAGHHACDRAISLFLEAGCHPRIVVIPDGEDPDSFLKKQGVKVLEKLLSEAKPAMEYLMLRELSHVGAQPSKRVEAVKKILPFVQSISTTLEQKSYLSRLAHFLGMGETTLLDMASAPVHQKKQIGVMGSKKEFSLERILIHLYVNYPQVVSSELTPEVIGQFEDEEVKNIAFQIVEQYKKMGGLNVREVLNVDPSFDLTWLSEMAFAFPELDNDKAIKIFFDDCFKSWGKKSLKNRLKKITGEIQLAEINNDLNALKELVEKKNEAFKAI